MPTVGGSSTFIPFAPQPPLLLDAVTALVQAAACLAQSLERVGGDRLEDETAALVDLGTQHIPLLDAQPTAELGGNDDLGSLSHPDQRHLISLSVIRRLYQRRAANAPRHGVIQLGASRCYDRRMRTTISLDDDVVAALERVRHAEGLGLSEAVNRLIRNGLRQSEQRPAVRLDADDLGLRIDISNVAEALELTEGPSWR